MSTVPIAVEPRLGDVLLYERSGVVSSLIRLFDGTDFSHAGLYVGDDEVGEAVAKGVVRQPLAVSVRGAKRVRVRRLIAPAPLDPVVDRARQILAEGERYSYEQIMLLAFLCLTRRLPLTPSLHLLVRRVLDSAASRVAALLAGGREPMICSEFVYRCYDEALPAPDDVYTLEIDALAPAAGRRRASAALPGGRGRGIHPESLLAWALAPSSRAWAPAPPPAAGRPPSRRAPGEEGSIDGIARQYLEELSGARPPSRRAPPRDDVELRSAVLRFALALQGPEGLGGGAALRRAARTPLEGLAYRAADFVTPGDLAKSPSLYDAGTLARRGARGALRSPGSARGARRATRRRGAGRGRRRR
jgi:hypothetical protein